MIYRFNSYNSCHSLSLFFLLFLFVLIPQFHPDRLGISTFVRADVELRQVDDVFRFEGDVGRGITLHGDWGDTHCDDTEFTGSTYGEIDDPALDIRSTIRHSYNHFLAVGRIGHLQQRTEGVGAMGAGQTVVVQPFTAGRPPS